MSWSCSKEMSVKKSTSKRLLGLFAILMFAGTAGISPALAQIETVDPNDVIGADQATPAATPATQPAAMPTTNGGNIVSEAPNESDVSANIETPDTAAGTEADGTYKAPTPNDGETFQDDDLIGAAEGVFGKGAKGLAGVIEDILKKQGRPNAYIAGREASGAFIVGLRYGSGKLYHKIEGERPVYWTGPSIGFDVGGNAANSFILVYNLYDTEELFRRFPAGEGAAYFIGGFHVSYLRSGDKVLIPVRLGAGLRLGANIGYMKFSKEQKWMPF